MRIALALSLRSNQLLLYPNTFTAAPPLSLYDFLLLLQLTAFSTMLLLYPGTCARVPLLLHPITFPTVHLAPLPHDLPCSMACKAFGPNTQRRGGGAQCRHHMHRCASAPNMRSAEYSTTSCHDLTCCGATQAAVPAPLG